MGYPDKPASLAAKLKKAVASPTRTRPVARPVYRPQPAPKALQPKAVFTAAPRRNPPASPPVYRPQPAPRVLQPKVPDAARNLTPPQAPAVYRPEPKKVVQPKATPQTHRPAQAPKPAQAPPVYRPRSAPSVLQTKTAPTATAPAVVRHNTATARGPRPSTQKPTHVSRPQAATPRSLHGRVVNAPRGQAAQAKTVAAFPRVMTQGPWAVSSAVQMMPVKGEIEEGGEGRGEHHPIYKFKVGTGSTISHDLDPWITKTGKVGYQNSKHSLYIGKSDRKRLRKSLDKIVNAWDGSKSIIHALLKEFYGVSTEDWTDWDIDPNKIAIASYEAQQSLVIHLLALQENIMRREGDIPANCYNVNLTTKPRVGVETTERVAIGWTTILKEARVLLKAQLVNKAAAPAAPASITLLQTAVQNTTDAGIVKLKNLGLLTDIMQLYAGSKRKGHNLYTAEGDGVGSFNFGYGHLRFILFLEWRIVDDLRTLFA